VAGYRSVDDQPFNKAREREGLEWLQKHPLATPSRPSP
jgi:hypothetical protein